MANKKPILKRDRLFIFCSGLRRKGTFSEANEALFKMGRWRYKNYLEIRYQREGWLKRDEKLYGQRYNVFYEIGDIVVEMMEFRTRVQKAGSADKASNVRLLGEFLAIAKAIGHNPEHFKLALLLKKLTQDPFYEVEFREAFSRCEYEQRAAKRYLAGKSV